MQIKPKLSINFSFLDIISKFTYLSVTICHPAYENDNSYIDLPSRGTFDFRATVRNLKTMEDNGV